MRKRLNMSIEDFAEIVSEQGDNCLCAVVEDNLIDSSSILDDELREKWCNFVKALTDIMDLIDPYL